MKITGRLHRRLRCSGNYHPSNFNPIKLPWCHQESQATSPQCTYTWALDLLPVSCSQEDLCLRSYNPPVHPLSALNACWFRLIITYIIFLFARNWVAADFSVLNSSEVPVEERTFQTHFTYNKDSENINSSSSPRWLFLCKVSATSCCWVLCLMPASHLRTLHRGTHWVKAAFPREGYTYIFSISCFSSKALGRSLLFPSTRTWNAEQKETAAVLLKETNNQITETPNPTKPNSP